MSALKESLKNTFGKTRTVMPILDYLGLCRKDPSVYATAQERMLKAAGEPEIIDTKNDPRLSRIYMNRQIKRYPSFSEFYGMEEVIAQVISFFKHAAQGLEERKQVLYLLGPVGGGKSSIAEKLKSLMEREPIYRLVVRNGEDSFTPSPVNESPLGIFEPNKLIDGDSITVGEYFEKEYGISRRYMNGIASPWAIKRLQEFEGDFERFYVERVYPSMLKQIAITKTEPGDENNQDISALVGKVDIRKLNRLAQEDPDAYSYSGGLCLANQGLLEFVEMFKAPIKMLHPLLTATQEGNYKGTEGISAIPFSGIILAHSNESEWLAFRNNKSNEAFLDRVYIVKVPYCLQVQEETEIYRKLLRNSALAEAPCAPGTLEMMAQFSVLSRISEPENSSIYSKMRVYDGENLKDTEPNAKNITEYKDAAKRNNEGMTGVSTRFAFKILSAVFNYDQTEVAANPVHLLHILEERVGKADLPEETSKQYLAHIKGFLAPRYAEFIGKEIQTAYLESYSEYGQNIFDRYVTYADYWIQDEDYRDPDTGESFDRRQLSTELEKIEKPAGIANPKDFRNEIVNFVLRARANNGGKNPVWTSYEKLREVIEKKMFSNTEELLPVISFNAKASAEDKNKHENFVARMVAKGYTEKQVRLLCEWYLRTRKSQ